MAANSSSNPSNFLLNDCFNSRVSIDINIAINATRIILILPLCTLVLYLGYQRWRQQRSFKTTSHSDIFTYHVAAMELIWSLGGFICICGIFANVQKMAEVGIHATSLIFYGETLFHALTCVERYLAVVHPVTYMGLKNARGVRIRNISIGCVWLLSFVLMGVQLKSPVIPLFLLLVFSLIVVCFCSLSVLCALIRPGPGEGGRERERVDQSKQRAFYTITAILGVLSLWFICFLVAIGLYSSPLLSSSVRCAVVSCAAWFNLPSCLVSPLLYLHRAGKLSCC